MAKMTHDNSDYKLMLNPKRKTANFEIDNSLVNEFSEIFEKLKGEPKTLRSDHGQIHLPYIIDFKINQNNLKVFKRKINQNSGTIILLIDGSGTMRFNDRAEKCRNLTANLFKAISEISRLNLKAYIYGGDFEQQKTLCITEINDLKDCEKITADPDNYGSTPTHNAINYVMKQNENIKGKKIIITLTDGKPEIWQNRDQVRGIDDQLKLESKKALVDAESKGFSVFGVGIGLYDTESFKNMFRDEYINVNDASDIKKYMIDKLMEFVRGIR